MHRILFAAVLIIGLLINGTAQTSLPRARSDKELSKQIHTYLTRLEKFGYSGAVLVAKDEKVVMERASRYFPVSNNCFVRFNAAEGRVSSQLCFDRDKTGKQIAAIVQDATRVALKSFE